MNYEESCQKALTLDYQAIEDLKAYLGVVFVKDNLKWVHNIEALRRELGVTTDELLTELGYNVSDYYEYKNVPLDEVLVVACKNELKEIFYQLGGADIFIDGCSATYLCDGVYITEGGELIDTKS